MTALRRMPRVSALFLLMLLLGIAANVSAQSESPLRSGPMLGYVEMMEANIWMQTRKAENVYLTYWNLEKPDQRFKTPPVKTSPEGSFIATFKLRHLEPGKDYMYEVTVGGKKMKFEYVTRFKTQAHWMFRSEPPNFIMALGSCLYTNDEPYDRPGDPYGGNYEILTTIRKNSPDIMLWLGDNLYFREPEFYSRSRMDYRYAYTRALHEMQPLLGTAINLAAWDDHDFGPNDSDRSYRNKSDALELFKKYWMNPSYGGENNPGIYTRYQFSDVEFFILDNRYHRAPNKWNGDPKPYWGAEQLQWLKESLVSSQATFKFIVNGNQVINANSKHEALATLYKEEYSNFMNWLATAKIDGVIFLSGDRHHTELLKLDRPESYPLYEYTSSPLTSGVHDNLEEEIENPLRVDKTLVNTTRNFGLIRVEGTRKNRILTMQAFDVKGVLLWDYKIEAAQLKHSK